MCSGIFIKEKKIDLGLSCVVPSIGLQNHEENNPQQKQKDFEMSNIKPRGGSKGYLEVCFKNVLSTKNYI